MSDLAPLLGKMAPNLLKGFLDIHSCGVSVLPACHRPEEAEGIGEGTISDALDLVAQAFDIVVGECRGGEALEMLQAMNTGHSGSMTTLHANSSKDALTRIFHEG